jgi:tripeptide aminopeptidase
MATKTSASRIGKPAARPKASLRLAAPAAPSTNLAVNRDEALRLVFELLAIPGGSGREQQVAQYIVAKLQAAGATDDMIRFDRANRKSPFGGEVGNLIVQLPGTVRGPRRLLMAHMDTVPICAGAKPVVRGKYIYAESDKTGLGGDDRAGCSVTLGAALRILRDKLPHPPLTFLWTVQEEVGLYGARFVQAGLLGKPALAFNWDGGSASKITVGATGGYRMAITIDGLASHAGNAPEHGVSAIAIASLAIAELVRDGWHGDVQKGNRRGTSNVGVIHGGEATNVVTERVELKAEARSHDPKFRAQIVKAFEKAFQSAAKQVVSAGGQRGKVAVDGRLDYESFRLSDDEPCVLAAEAAVRATGLEPMRAVTNGGLDANWMNEHRIPTVTLGCGQMEIHTSSEKLALEDYYSACDVALRLATVDDQ